MEDNSYPNKTPESSYHSAGPMNYPDAIEYSEKLKSGKEEWTESSKSASGSGNTYVIAIASQKGGVAKTTTVVSLGGALAQLDKEVLVVDLDAQANLTLALGNNPARVRNTITEVLFNSATILSVSRETQIPGLDLVPSNFGMELAERFLPVRKDYETILQRAIKTELQSGENKPSYNDPLQPNSVFNFQPFQASGSGQTSTEVSSNPSNHPVAARFPTPIIHYDFTLLDCPPSLGAVTTNALIAADMLIIPTQPEYFSAHALRTMMDTIRQIRKERNPKMIYRILVTMSDQRNRIHRNLEEQIRSTFGEGVFQTRISIDTKLRESAVAGLPITHHRSQSRSALQYTSLAQEIMQYVR